MFNQDLFFELCAKYGVEVREGNEKPKIKENGRIRDIDEYDICNIIKPCIAYFDYGDEKMYFSSQPAIYDEQDDLAIAC